MDPELRRIWEVYMLALGMWREADDQPADVIAVVGCSIRNRVLRPRWWGSDWISVLLHEDQYSCFDPFGSPNNTRFPLADNAVFPQCLHMASDIHDGIGPDLAKGADSYFDRSLDAHPPKWASDGSKVHVLDAGDFHFYRTLDAMAA